MKPSVRTGTGKGRLPARLPLSIAAAAVIAVTVLGLVRCGSTGAAPTDVVLSAASDTTVRISWGAPAGGAPDNYVTSFMETGTSTWVDFDTAADSATTIDHNPLGKTGKYRVTAVFGGKAYAAAETPTSAPIHTEAMFVSELNAPGLPAYGWARDSGNGATFVMTYASNADRVDFYITDWATGYAGPVYAIASPDWAPHEPGGQGVVPPGTWRATSFGSVLPGDQGPLPPFSSGTYGNNVELAMDSTLVAVCTDPDTDTLGTGRCYALVKVGSPDTANGTVQVETWFQVIRGLRLIQH